MELRKGKAGRQASLSVSQWCPLGERQQRRLFWPIINSALLLPASFTLSPHPPQGRLCSENRPSSSSPFLCFSTLSGAVERALLCDPSWTWPSVDAHILTSSFLLFLHFIYLFIFCFCFYEDMKCYIERPPGVGRLSLKSWDNTTPQELTRDRPCCNHTRFIDRNQHTGAETHIPHRGRGVRPRVAGRRGI